MIVVQRQGSCTDAAGAATIWVIDSDARIRHVVETAVQDYPLHLRVRLVFSVGLQPPETVPSPELLLINLTAAPESCLDLVPKIRRQWPDTKVIFLSQSDDIRFWAEAIRRGAYEFLPSSVEPHQLGWVLQGALWTHRRAMAKA